VFVATGGAIWFGTENGGIVRWQSGVTEDFGGGPRIDRRYGRVSFAMDSTGGLWAAAGRFVGRHDGSRFETVPGDFGRSAVVAAAGDGGVWIATRERLSRWRNGHLETIVDSPSWPGRRSRVACMQEDPSGALWIGTLRRGLYRVEKGTVFPIPTQHDSISSLCSDAGGEIWVGTNGGGVSRVRRRSFVLLNQSAGFPDDVSSSVCVDAAGAVWCANRLGGLVRRTAAGQASVVPMPGATGPDPLDVTTVCPDGPSRMWVATRENLFLIDPGAPDASAVPVDPPIARVNVLHSSQKTGMWVGTGTGGLAVRTGEDWRWFSADDGWPGETVGALADTQEDGGLLVGTNAGNLFEFRDGLFARRDIAIEAEDVGRINGIHVDAGGAAWIATSSGLIFLQGSRAHRLSEADGLPDDFIHRILADDQGYLWFGGRRGLFAIAIPELMERLDGRRRRVASIIYGRNEGLAGASTFSGGQPMAWKGGDGTLWFATHRGVVGIDPRRSVSMRPPTVHFDAVSVDGRAVALADRLVARSGEAVAVDVEAINLAAPEQVRVRHRVLGLEEAWTEADVAQRIGLSAPPPGTFTIQVQAQNRGQPWTDPPLSMEIVIVPAWWQTAWFRVLGSILILGAAIGLVRAAAQWRLRRRVVNLERENALERERARIARDLHDELGGSISRIGLMAERLKRHATDAGSRESLSRLAWQARRAAGDLDNIVWAVSPEHDTWDTLCAHVAAYAQDFFRDTQVECVVEGVESAPPEAVNPEVQHHVIAVAREAMNNSLKHAAATRIDVRIACAGSVFSIVIADNGAGFDPGDESVDDGNGLGNMRARAARIGAELQIDTKPGRGTTVTLSMPLAARPGSEWHEVDGDAGPGRE
jgi:signal transduction histidine kinase